ncbi:MAG: hypothetical protein A3C53_06705 [Omnitrophica WOR_2 bacterium RIFCSPHIGHO2_02_FULL_68_15]|nr:MAG: hypothetical protein A3C53_06705 [Omnitrophica WOR_2 bacterium RIFCSPHIGHO2_02_FULL_68_15]
MALRTQAGLESEPTRTTLTATLTGLEEMERFALPDLPTLTVEMAETFERLVESAARSHETGMAALRERRYAAAVVAFTDAQQEWSGAAGEGWERFQSEYLSAGRRELAEAEAYLDLALAQTVAALAFAQQKAGPSSGLARLDRPQTGLEEFELPGAPTLNGGTLKRDLDAQLASAITAHGQGLVALQASRYAAAVRAFTTAKWKWPAIANEVSGWTIASGTDRTEIETYLEFSTEATAAALAFAESKVPHGTDALDAGLEEPTLADVQQALAALDGLRWRSDTVHSTETYAVVFAGEAAPGAALMHRMLSGDNSPSWVPYAVTSDADVRRRLTAAGLLGDRVLDVPLNQLQPSATGNPIVLWRPISRLLTTEAEALDYLTHTLGGSLQFPDGPDPDRLTAAITHALNVLSAYL